MYDIGQAAQFGIGVAALGVLVYVITLFTRFVNGSSTANELKELTRAIETNSQATTRLCFLIEQQGMFIKQMMERMDAIWQSLLQQG